MFVTANGHARMQTIQVGQRSGLQAQVLDGLKVGDKVIVHPDDKVLDGVRIKVRSIEAH